MKHILTSLLAIGLAVASSGCCCSKFGGCGYRSCGTAPAPACSTCGPGYDAAPQYAPSAPVYSAPPATGGCPSCGPQPTFGPAGTLPPTGALAPAPNTPVAFAPFPSGTPYVAMEPLPTYE